MLFRSRFKDRMETMKNLISEEYPFYQERWPEQGKSNLEKATASTIKNPILMAGLSFHDRLHIQRMLAQQAHLQSMFAEFIRKVSPELTKMSLTGKPNVWHRNARIEANIDKYLAEFANELSQYISGTQSDAWARSTLKCDDLVNEYIKGMAVDSTVKQGMFNRNAAAFKAFTDRTKNGFTLSEQIWGLTTETKKQLEFYVASGISDGRSAAKISQDIRHLLTDPDTQFRRKRDENGKLIPSQPMKDYHSGQGEIGRAHV